MAYAATPDLIALVRTGDYARFLLIQLAPREARAALYTITGFAVELESVRAKTNEPLTGMLRYTWWREQLESIAAGAMPKQHPLLVAMAELHRTHATAFGDALTMLARHQEALEMDAHAEVEDLLAHAWGSMLDKPQAARLAALQKWLTEQDNQRLQRPGVLLPLLWKALKYRVN